MSTLFKKPIKGPVSETDSNSTEPAEIDYISPGDIDATVSFPKIYAGRNLCGTNFSGQDLSSAVFGRANLTNTDISNATLVEADFGQANLSGANLSGSDLRKADLRGANLKGAILKNTDLRGANLRDAILENIQIDENTLMDRSLKINFLASAPAQTKPNASSIASWKTGIGTTHKAIARREVSEIYFELYDIACRLSDIIEILPVVQPEQS